MHKRHNSLLGRFLHLLLFFVLSISSASATLYWKDFDALLLQGNLSAAIQSLDKQLEASRAQNKQSEWTEVLIRGSRLRALQAQPEAGVEYLNQQSWPDQPLYQILLHVRSARELEHYLNKKSWDQLQLNAEREQRFLSVKDRSLSVLRDQLKSHYLQAYLLAEQHDTPISELTAFLEAGEYPASARGNLLDYVAALWINFLCDDVYWTELEQQSLKNISLSELLKLTAETPEFSSQAHPLQQVYQISERLRHRYIKQSKSEAAFEASRYYASALRRYFASDQDLLALSRYISEQMKVLGSQYAWWTMGQYLLADFARQLNQRDALVKAHALATQASLVHPDSEGARRSKVMLSRLEHREYAISSQGSSGLKQAAIKVDYRNIQRLYFRAWKIDRSLPTELDEVQKHAVISTLLAKAAEQSWTAELPDHWDLRQHSTQVTPEINAHGQWLILASPQEDFIGGMKHLQFLEISLSRFVARANYLDGEFQIAVYDGQYGRAMADVTVELLEVQGSNLNVLASSLTDQQGIARIERQRDADFFQIQIRQGDDRTVISVPGLLPLSDEKRWLVQPATAVIITDRSTYINQPLLKWTLIAAAPAGSDDAWSRAYAKQTGWLRLYDANNELVGEQIVKTGAAGQMSGEFSLTDRVSELNAGEWLLESSWNSRALIQVAKEAETLPSIRIESLPTYLTPGKRLTVKGRVDASDDTQDQTIHWQLRRSKYLVNQETLYDELQSSVIVANQHIHPDKHGAFTFEISSVEDYPDDKHQHVHYELVIELLDEQGVQSQVHKVLHGVQLQNRIAITAMNNFVLEGDAAEFDVIKTDSAHQGVQDQTPWYLYRLQPSGQQAPHDLVRVANKALSHWLTGPLQRSGKLEHQEQGIATLSLTGLIEGAYRLRVIDGKAQSPLQQDYDFMVVAEGVSHKPAVNGVLLSQNNSIEPGNTLRLMVGSGLSGQWSRLSILHQGQQLASQMLSPGIHLLEYPILERHQGGLSFNLEWVRQNQLYSEAIFVDVPWALKQLQLQLDTDATVMLQATGTGKSTPVWQLGVRDSSGNVLSEPGGIAVVRIQELAPGDDAVVTTLADLSRLYLRDSQRIMSLNNNTVHYSQYFKDTDSTTNRMEPLKLPGFIYSAENNERYKGETAEFMIFSMMSNTRESSETFQNALNSDIQAKPRSMKPAQQGVPRAQFFYPQISLKSEGTLQIPVPDALQEKPVVLQVLVVTPDLKTGQLSVIIR